MLAGNRPEEALMFARVAAFEGVNVNLMEERSKAALASGEMTLPEGCTRAMALADRHRLETLFITFFDSREAIAAAEEHFEKMGEQIPEEVRGRRASVRVWEVVYES
jgi:hypothetical protein